MISTHKPNSVTLPDAFVDELGRATTLFELLKVSARWIPTMVDADRASLALVADDGQSLELIAMGDKTTIANGTCFDLDDTIVGRAYTSQQTVAVDDVSSRPETDMQQLAQHGFSSALAAPLMSAGRALGTINVGRLHAEPFDELSHQRLRSVASLLASYIWIHLQLEREQERSRWDGLTKLLNRKTILEELQTAIAASTDPESLAILFVDIDGFKAINDAYGHVFGDAVLSAIGLRLSEAVRSQDSVGRLGGDEFLAICPTSPSESADEIARRLVDHCSQPITAGSITIRPRISVGITTPRSNAQTIEELMAEADHAMYRAKHSQTSVCTVDAEIRRQADHIVAIDRELGQALNADTLDFHFQPILSVDSGEIAGAEALLRWHHPELGAIAPSLILERIEATGEIEAFTKWSLDRICSHWTAVRHAIPALAHKPVAINLNPSQLQIPDYADWHIEMLTQHSLEPADVHVEIVESGLIDVNARSERNLRQLADQGVIVSLDDFGTGYNALAYFARFPIHGVKFDRSLTERLPHDHKIRTIVAGLAQITKDLGIVSLAEGVETEEEMSIVREIGMDRVQGYLFGRAMPIDTLIAFAREHSPLQQV